MVVSEISGCILLMIMYAVVEITKQDQNQNTRILMCMSTYNTQYGTNIILAVHFHITIMFKAKVDMNKGRAHEAYSSIAGATCNINSTALANQPLQTNGV